MLAGTEKSKEIRRYFLRMENVFFETIKEELQEQSQLIEYKDQQICEKNQKISEKDQRSTRECKAQTQCDFTRV